MQWRKTSDEDWPRLGIRNGPRVFEQVADPRYCPRNILLNKRADFLHFTLEEVRVEFRKEDGQRPFAHAVSERPVRIGFDSADSLFGACVLEDCIEIRPGGPEFQERGDNGARGRAAAVAADLDGLGAIESVTLFAPDNYFIEHVVFPDDVSVEEAFRGCTADCAARPGAKERIDERRRAPAPDVDFGYAAEPGRCGNGDLNPGVGL